MEAMALMVTHLRRKVKVAVKVALEEMALNHAIIFYQIVR